MMLLAAILASTILAITCILDLRITIKGLAAGVALEGNWLIDKVFSTKPTVKQLILFWLLTDGMAIGISILLAVFNNPACILPFGYMSVMAGKHLAGYREWKKFIK